jgi:hypothetical protein
LDEIRAKRAKVDPFESEHYVEDVSGYSRLAELTEAKMEALIDVLIVECVTAHLKRETKLVSRLAAELKIDFREHWHPDSKWLSSYQKIQLSHLLSEVLGSTYDPSRETRKKSELVDAAAKLFSDAADGKMEDKVLAERVNRWLPANLRDV